MIPSARTLRPRPLSRRHFSIVTTSITAAQLVVVLEESFNGRKFTNRNLIGLDVTLTNEGNQTSVRAVNRLSGGQPIAAGERVTIALNSYDAQSGSRRFLLVWSA